MDSVQLSRDWKGILGNSMQGLVNFHISLTKTGQVSFPPQLGEGKKSRTEHPKLSSLYLIVYLL